jgi:hypothetical protein
MTELESSLRKAFRAKASQITPPPPPLELQPLPAHDPAARRGSGGFWTPPQRRRLIPLAAAVAVLAVVAAALAAASALTPRRKPQPPAAPIQISVPPYYVALDSQRPPSSHPEPVATATVRDTATGAVLARITPPSPYNSFVALSGAANDRTFVLLAKAPLDPLTGVTPERFYLLRIDPGASSVRGRAVLTALPASDIPGGQGASELPLGNEVGSIALSPDGSMLAAILTVMPPGKHGVHSTRVQDNYLDVYNLRTGTTRIWVRKLCGRCRLAPLGNQAGAASDRPGLVNLSWTADGKALAFISGPGVSQLRLLKLSVDGENVQSASTPFAIKAPVSRWTQAVMTPDARTVFLDFNSTRGFAVSVSLMRYTAATGKLAAMNTLPLIQQDRRADGYSNSGPLTADTILWTNYDGSKLIVADAQQGHTAGVYSGSSYTPLPWPADVIDAAW